jgi:chemotaxis protein MotB
VTTKPGHGKRTIVVRREEVVEGGHHGGAWKVAYADFVTAMMAFFLLMWLINATTDIQRRGLADYFTPNNLLSHGTSGNGAPFGGHTPFDAGSMVSDRGVMTILPGKATPTAPRDDDEDPPSAQAVSPHPRDEADGSGGAQTAAGTAEAGPRGAVGRERPDPRPAPDGTAAGEAAADARAETARFDRTAQQVREAIRADPALAPVARQIAIDQTPEGLRIQLLDEEHQPMFASGSSTLNDRARLVLRKIAPILAKLPEGLSVSGHTDAAPYRNGDRGNWELSSERANATRRLLVEAGVAEGRFRGVTGNADRDLLLPADPFAPENRRIAIVALRDGHAARP